MTEPAFRAQQPTHTSAGEPANPIVAIIGLGLIGGSIARDLAACGLRVLGYDRDAAAVARAVREGVLTTGLNDDFAGIERADWVILAVPVDAAPDLLRAMSADLRRARLVTDVGSTKRAVAAAAAECGLDATFVGSHPLAGGEESGWAASRAGLFELQRVYLCPAPTALPAALAEARALWSLCGAQAHILDASAHDSLVAWSSHLPQLVSSALATVLHDGGVASPDIGPGARSMLRLAASSPDVWSGILHENADHVTAALAALTGVLERFRTALDARDDVALRSLLGEARAYAPDRVHGGPSPTG